MSYLPSLFNEVKAKILFLVFDGLGGLPDPATGKTELETARTPHLDGWAAQGAVGLHDPIAPGITPGSGPAHLGLFGYDPIADNVGSNVASGQVTSAQVTVGTAPAAGESMTILVRATIGGTAATIASILVDDTFAANSVTDLTFSVANEVLSGSTISVVRTYTAGMAPAPMTDTNVRVEIAPVRR